VILDRGQVLQEGPVADVFARPTSVVVARIVGVETVEPAQVIEVNSELATVVIGQGARLQAALSRKVRGSSQMHVCIRAENVIVEKGDEAEERPRNHLRGQVKEVCREGLLTRAVLDCGFPLVALLTPKEARKLELRAGERVTAVVSAEDVHLAVNEQGPIREPSFDPEQSRQGSSTWVDRAGAGP
jgi:ABC-type molybdate transport system ATPase subunit